MAMIIRKPLPCNCGRPARIMHTLGQCTVGCLRCNEWSGPYQQQWRAIRDWNRRRTSHRNMSASGTAFAETVLSERDPDIWECPVCFARTTRRELCKICRPFRRVTTVPSVLTTPGPDYEM